MTLSASRTRWILTLDWTALTLSLLLSPSGEGTTVSGISDIFGGTEITDAIGHVIMMAILALLWCWTVSLYASAANTLRLVLVGGIAWGVAIELSQSLIPGRESALLDIGANLFGVVVGLAVYRRLIRLLGERPAS